MSDPTSGYDVNGYAPAADADALRRSIPYWGGFLWSVMQDTDQPISSERADEFAAYAVEDYIASCLTEET